LFRIAAAGGTGQDELLLRTANNKLIGNLPRWRSDGKEMFYDTSGQMMAMDLA